MRNKTLLTIDDLVKFCEEQKFAKFSSNETGYKLAVKVPTTFESEDSVDENHRGMKKVKIKIFHTGVNRNKSRVSKESAERAMKTIPDRPVLAAIHQLDDGSWDFEGHEMKTVRNEETGEDETVYIESQVGSFSSEPAFWEHDDKLDKDFVCAYAYIAEDYTRTTSILEEKNGTKNSCELVIEELSYDAKEKVLDLDDFYLNASTFLGSRDDGTEIGEGMEGSRADIVDFSEAHNSVLIDLQTRLSNVESKLEKVCFNNNTQINQKGGNDLVKFEELLKKYNVTADDITFDYEGLSDEELEQKFAETFDDDGGAASDDGAGDAGTTDGNSDPEPTSDENADEGNGESDPVEEPVNEEGAGETQEENPVSEESEDEPVATSDDSKENPVEEEACGADNKKKRKYSITTGEKSANFEVSLDEKIWALSDLVNAQYGESDNCWYSVKVYENYLIMYDYWTCIAYKQTYSQDGDNFSLTGDRVEVYATYLTKEELDEVEAMRSNYASLVEYKENAEFAKLHTQREEILNAEKYNDLRDTDEFKALVENMDQYSLVDLEKEAKVIFADFITSNAGTFSAHTSETKSKKKFNGGMTFGVGSEKPEADNENSPYGDYFKSLKK
ncbi:hypothetical protein RO865_06285 [Blautia faecis]|jgi:hypothetical protein|uniref:hypothetical protein n=1 Tax=Blautia faecis TaxID=871665 RepID=UPI002055B43E|nr:hypothetical protein [Blautia faecis]MDT4368430.1 hypothetical protein [Blautia faecis]DAT03779.1 MAG TPA: hypothetical protein [Caudoviricetes sp.]